MNQTSEQLIADCNDKVVAVHIKSIISKIKALGTAFSSAHLMHHMQSSWPLSKDKIKSIEHALNCPGDGPVVVLGYVNNPRSNFPIDECREVKGVFILDPHKKLVESEQTFGRWKNRRTDFFLNPAPKEIVDKYLGKNLKIGLNNPSFPQLLGKW